MHALDSPHGDFFLGWRRCAVLVQLSGVRFRDVVIVEAADHDLLLPAERAADFDPIAGANQSIRFGRLFVYGDFSAAAGLLCF
jgi:hypothetical protein